MSCRVFPCWNMMFMLYVHLNCTGYRFTFLKELNDSTTPDLKDTDKLTFDRFLIPYQSGGKINASFRFKTKISPSFADQP